MNKVVELIELDIPEPIGKFILDQEDVIPVMTNNGAYYHYADVCKMLNRIKEKYER